ncbi:DUF1501 domain-containing protein [Urechidicola croceus]|uniref:Twin-arginine translocation pathway signal sequence domain protein n=1 Tax=Urechidicola croceus TaxID=1850246 RepID=A0A1D8P5T7_9FLAO|nr:DUF1501 domain-containing protein [Urechidicola croceus]AOW19933.1 Twin-arginine translocation pathway signal sequence domain protein precursor [Urechidicola croceus]
MLRRNFLNITCTITGGALMVPEFLWAFGTQNKIRFEEESLIFIQLNGGNDGLNTYIPFNDPLYQYNRPSICISKDDVIGANKNMAFHPSLKNFFDIQQDGNLSIIQNVGYSNPTRSHFKSQEIWQTAVNSNMGLNNGWLGRYLDAEFRDHNPIAGINISRVDHPVFKSEFSNSASVQNPKFYKKDEMIIDKVKLSSNPQLDFVRKIATATVESSKAIQKAISNSKEEIIYPKTNFASKLSWIARLIKGNLNSKIYYTSLGGFDTHKNQLNEHSKKLTILNDGVYSFYKDLKEAKLLQNVTIVIFSEFGRRVKDNGNGTDHGKAAPMFIIGGNNNGSIIGNNPDLANLDDGDLKYNIDFRSVYATLLRQKLHFNPRKIGIKLPVIEGIF